jgi:DNA polymerase-4
MERSILHVDIAAFPIAVERVVEPALRGRAVLVAPPGTARGVVLTASAEAARDGVRAGMPVAAALRRCPDAVVLPPNEPLYRRAADALTRLLAAYSPLVEPATWGQTFLDLTGTGRLFGQATDAAARIQRDIAARLRLHATAGIAVNKLVSRAAARVIRPAGLCDIFPGGEAPFLAPLPIGYLPAAGAMERERCADLNIVRVADLLRFSPLQARVAFGWRGGLLRAQALGVDEAPVRPPEAAPAVTVDETLAEDANDTDLLLACLCRLCDRAGARLRRLGARARRLRLTLRYADAVMGHREARLDVPAAADLVLFESTRALFDAARDRRVRLRWIELRCGDLVRGPRQLELFGPEAFAGGGGRPDTPPAWARAGAADAIAGAVDRIRARFGAGAIGPGRIALAAGQSAAGSRRAGKGANGAGR